MRPAVYERARRREWLGVPIVADIDHPERRTLDRCDGTAAGALRARRARRSRDRGPVRARGAGRARAAIRAARAARHADRRFGGARTRAGGRAAARPHRHSHVYTHDLRGVRPELAEPGLRAARRVDRPARRAPARLPRRVRPRPSRPDGGAPRPRRHLERILAGELGPLLPGSGLAIAPTARSSGAILHRARSPTAPPPFGGPWVIEVFRAPRRGRRARAAAAGAAPHGGQPRARRHRGQPRPSRLYDALGFRRIFTAFSVDL